MTSARLTLGAATLAAIVVTTAPLVSTRQADRASIVEYVSVLSADGTPIDGLPPTAFQLTSDDQPITIGDVSSIAAPMTMAVVLDATASVGANLELPSKVLERALLPRLRERDRARVLTVATSPFVGDRWTSDVSLLKSSIKQALDGSRTGPSPIWDTLWHAGRALSTEPGPRVVLLATDGRTSGNEHGYLDVLYRLSVDGITVAVIASAQRETLGQMAGKLAVVRPDVTLRDLAAQTGGPFYVDRNIPTRTPTDLRLESEVIVGRMMAELQRRYAIRFSAPADGQFHRLRVTVQHPGATVRARAMFLSK